MSFRDLFSEHAAEYARARPLYPPELFQFLRGQCTKHDLAWDVGTGNGQAAVMLARDFNKVIATDPSSSQIANAMKTPRVSYRVESAEEPTLNEGSVDLITAAQAAHWFDLDRFCKAARSVMKPTAIIAVWCYGLHRMDPDIDEIIDRLYHSLLGEYWPRERRYIENHYRDLPFPFTEVDTPSFVMECHWTMEELFAYLDTWSAVRSYRFQTGDDPLLIIRNEMLRAWGTTRKRRMVTWPLFIRAGHK